MAPRGIDGRREYPSVRSKTGRLAATRLAATLGLLLGALLLSCAPALAAAPEAPETETPSEVRATTAVFHGVLNPNKEGEGGTYEFVYRASKTECQGGSAAPEPPGMSLGLQHEEVSQEVAGLEPHTEYTVCLLARNGAETSVGPPVTFKTALPPEVPVAEEATEVTGTTATLKGVLNPGAEGEPGSYEFMYASSATECAGAEEGSTSAPNPPAPASGHQNEAVEVAVANLRPHTTYVFCLIARNDAGDRAEGPSVSFTTEATAPIISEETALPSDSSTETLLAKIAPDGLSTAYHVEYVSESQFQAHGFAEATRLPVPDAELPAASAPVLVSESLGGLSPHSAYRFRFLATNALATATGAEQAFTTAVASPSGLPDNRAYELVSTAGTGEPYLPPTPIPIGPSAAVSRSRLQFQAAANGDAVTYAAEPADTEGSGATGPGLGNQWLATRTLVGWTSVDITPGAANDTAYQTFSSSLDIGILEGGSASLTSDVPDGCQALYAHAADGGALRALFSAGSATPESCGRPLFAGASEDESQIIFQSEAALTANSEAATELPAGHGTHAGGEAQGEPCMFGCNLYDIVRGNLTLVNVIEGKTVPNATFGGYPEGEARSTNFSNVISADGSRVFWTDTQAGPDMEHVYVLEDGTHTVQVSGAGAAEYWAATRDGRYAYYTEGGQLWRFDTTVNTRQSLAGEGAEVQAVIGTNQTGEDGAYVYLIADGVLAQNQNAHGEAANAGQPNLYLLHQDTPVFIATLSVTDQAFETSGEALSTSSGDWTSNLGERTAQVTPDGSHIAFQSELPLTGYDNQSPLGGQPSPEVFVYSAESALLACASCSPIGTPPSIPEEGRSKVPVSEESNTYMRRWISENGGRVFFDSEEPLLAQDTNGVQDVYEWEREGEGTCTSRNASPLAGGGCIYLLSGGSSRNDSFLVDADASGENVFFEHVGPLAQVEAPVDHNELYDARARGGFPSTPPSCSGPGCQSVAPAAEVPAPPPSVTFTGSGNFPSPRPAAPPRRSVAQIKAHKLAVALKGCRKDRSKRKRIKCEKSARKKYGATKASRVTNKRRTHS
jgi:hypothetical protein